MKLVIVESPTKARKLSGYLGKSYQVEASIGHVRDLPTSKLGVDLERDFEPTYVVSKGKKKVVVELKKLAKKSQEVYLAMDPDREGEAIAWHIKFLLQDQLQSAEAFRRATFYEITQQAVLEAMAHPGKINQDLVDAQQARRIVDRLVGYKVSPVLWRKVRSGLSAGRVQSVALRLIVEREQEIESFEPEEYWEIEVGLQQKQLTVFKDQLFKAGKVIEELPDGVLVVSLEKVGDKKFQADKAKVVEPIVNDLKTADYQIQEIKRQERRRRSYAPFTTSTLQQTAANRLGYSAKQTMRLAQQLYEEGLITYHRTDSLNLASSAISQARDYISKVFGDNYLTNTPRVFRNKSKNVQEAHEAIRVTKASLKPANITQENPKFTTRHIKLYDLIWRRFLATQMKPAVYDQTTVWVKARPNRTKKSPTYLLKTTGSVMKFDGWTKLFPNSGDKLLPALSEGEDLRYLDINPLQKFTQPPPRYNDASLVKELEKRGIGRPSTYASIISVIQDRGYVERVDKRFKPTSIGTTVNKFLLKYFSGIMDYDFTAEMENDLDRIARGERKWRLVVRAFWEPLDEKIDSVLENADKMKVPVEKTGEKCPKCGQSEGGEIVIRTGRFGKFKSCSRFPDCKYTENLVETVGGITCPLCQQGQVVIKKTRWGKQFYGCSRYPECDWASWKKPQKGDKVSQQEWQQSQAKRNQRKQSHKTRRRKTRKTKRTQSAK